MGAIGSAVAGAVATKVLGGGKSTTKTEMDPFVKDMISQYSNAYQNSPTPQYNLDNLTAGMNPFQMEALAAAGNYANGQGADQVAMMNAAGLGQMGAANSLAQIGEAGALGSGGWLLGQLGKTGGGAGGGGYGGGGGGGNFSSDLKFEYDQDTYDQSYGNLIGSAQNAFDSFSNKTKTGNLFSNLPGIKIGSQMIGGANSKVGQGASLLDAMTNQMITDYGAQMQQWASGTADANAMGAGQGTLQAQTSNVNAQIAAAASRANAATAAAASKYNSLVGAAASMYGNSGSMLGAAGTQYGNAGVTFSNANDAAIGNIATSMGAGDYLYNYDQQALDRWNQANIYNVGQPGQMNLGGFQAANGISGGSTVTNNPSLLSELGGGMALGGMFYDLYQDNKPTAPTSSGGGGGGIGINPPGMFSDVRLKENIELIDTKDGINIYKWDWNEAAKNLGAPSGPSVGVLAQEMLSVRPNAVALDERSGYLMVNYDKIPEVRGA
jgi:hypothetical protein